MSNVEQAMIRERNQLAETFWTSPEGVRVRQLESAYKTLTGSEMPGPGDALETPAPPRADDVLDRSEPGASTLPEGVDEKRIPPGSTVKSLAVELFESEPGRTWTFDEMLAHFDRERIALPAKDPRDALRTAVGNLQKKDNLVERVGRGTYRLAPSPVDEGGRVATPNGQAVGPEPREVRAHQLPSEDR